MTKTEQARQIILQRFPCREIPAGALSGIAREIGCTPELVRQAANSLGLTGTLGGKRTLPRRVCASCGASMRQHSRQLVCMSCRHITVPCGTCGAAVDITVGKLTYRMRTGKYTGALFCSRPCFYESQSRSRAVLPDDPSAPHGTSPMYRRGCRCERCREYVNAANRRNLARRRERERTNAR